MDRALEALMTAQTVAVVGLDSREWRPAHRIARYLQEAGYRIIPVWFQEPADEVLGERAYASLRDVPVPVDVVDVFVRSEQTDGVIGDAVSIGAKCVWLQQGIRNEAAMARAEAAGLAVAEDRCTMVEHSMAARQG